MSFPTRNVALGLIARRPSYGYAVLQQLRRWAIRPASVRTSSVYTALARLTSDGLVEARPPAASPNGRPSRVFLRITSRGRDHLEAWLLTPPRSYEELRLRIALARPQDADRLVYFVAAAERSCLARLREHAVAPALNELLERENLPWEHLCGTLLSTLDVCELQGRAAWLRDARVALERVAKDAERRPGDQIYLTP